MISDEKKVISCENCGNTKSWARPNGMMNDRGQFFCCNFCREDFMRTMFWVNVDRNKLNKMLRSEHKVKK